MRLKLLVAIFVAWEAYWAYVYFSAPSPDSQMSKLFAIIVSLWSLIVVGGTAGLWWLIKRSVRDREKRF